MSITVMSSEELLELGTSLAKANRSLDLMDRTFILHGYLELTRLDPDNEEYRKDAEAAAEGLLEAAQKCGWTLG